MSPGKIRPVPTVRPLPEEAFVRPRRRFRPAYLKLWEEDRAKIEEKVERALRELRACRVCPRRCGVDRLADRTAVCRSGRHAYIGSAFPHFGEENALRGWNGSGTIFFSFCNLKCVFCQNFDLSWEGRHSTTLGPEQIAGLMLHLQRQGCHNINLVTPEHVVPQILEAIPIAIRRGLRLPIVYNTSAYDSGTSLELMNGVVDIYMPDFKFWDRETSKRLMAAEDYPDVARQRIREMHRQVGPLTFDEQGLALRGVLLRHLVLPGGIAGTPQIMRFVADRVSIHTYVNIMGQYFPAGRVTRKPEQYAELARPATPAEVEEAIAAAEEAGLYRFARR